jgi:AcrR family transcriptional regulator
MLRDALSGLLHEKDFEAISIQDIAERSTVNRATFYDHYTDKTALVEDFVLQRFNNLLAARQVHKQTTFASDIRALILAVCDFFTQRTGACSKQQRLFEPFVQSAIQKRLHQVLLEGLKQRSLEGDRACLAAATVSWAIYGAATHWVQVEKHGEPEVFADALSKLLRPILRTSGGGMRSSVLKDKRPRPARGVGRGRGKV